ncbi:MAG: hypothetical protein LBM65_01455 [Oscillospiraceae bacterium]|jgi:hypothetical protein|nr:hypothetical protein [Oscillospiraceae bacterium]
MKNLKTTLLITLITILTVLSLNVASEAWFTRIPDPTAPANAVQFKATVGLRGTLNVGVVTEICEQEAGQVFTEKANVGTFASATAMSNYSTYFANNRIMFKTTITNNEGAGAQKVSLYLNSVTCSGTTKAHIGVYSNNTQNPDLIENPSKRVVQLPQTTTSDFAIIKNMYLPAYAAPATTTAETTGTPATPSNELTVYWYVYFEEATPTATNPDTGEDAEWSELSDVILQGLKCRNN